MRTPDGGEEVIAVRRSGHGQLQLGAKAGEGRSKVVRRSDHERSLASDGPFDAAQHPVERPGQRAEFVVLRRLGEAPAQVAGPDRISRAREIGHRPEGSRREPPPAQDEDDRAGDPDERQRADEALKAPIDARDRTSGHDRLAVAGRNGVQLFPRRRADTEGGVPRVRTIERRRTRGSRS